MAKDLKSFERYLTTDLKPPHSIPQRVLWKTLKEILMAIDVMLLFVGIILGLFSRRIPYELLLTILQKVLRKTLKEGYLRL